MKKQARLFQEPELAVLSELDLKEAETIANQIKAAVSSHCIKIEVVGSIRRQRSKIHDIDFVAVTKNDAEWQGIAQELKRMKAKPSCSGNNIIKAYTPHKGGLFQVDFYRATSLTFGVHMIIRTGSAEHNMWLAAYAISRGMRLKYSQGLIKEGAAIAGQTEKEVFDALGLAYPLPPEREIVENRPLWLPPQVR